MTSNDAREVLYEVLKLHGWSFEKIEQNFNQEPNVKLLNTDEQEEIRCNIKFLEENNINKDIYFSLYNQKKKKDLEKNRKIENNKVLIEHPKFGRTISEFAKEVALIIKDKDKIFFRPDAKEVIEVRRIAVDNNKDLVFQGFSTIKPNRFITLIEDYITPYVFVFKKDEGWVEKKKSISSELANTTLCSDVFEQSLPYIKRLFGVPIPIMYQGELTFPNKGYDLRFNSWLAEDSPIIQNTSMTLEEAKTILNKILGEFCFKGEQDYSNAIAALLTPFLKGIFTNFNTRCPIFFYLANRERAGKDYLAGITGIIYEGNNLEEPPISTGEHNTGNNEELRKKILSALKEGRKRLHFQNNKGYLNNSILEAIATATIWSDRLLGKNETLTFDNELDISLSGNVGIGYTADFNNRCRKINLFLDIEDANARQFTTPNLHQWVKEHREDILSALYCLIRNWISMGSPSGKVPFASFPEWSRVCGGILECAGYMNPCNIDDDGFGLTGDIETADMKQLFELCYEKHPDKPMKKYEIIKLVKDSDVSIFSNLDLEDRSGQTKFGLKINKFVGRWLSNILLKVDDVNVRSARQQLTFTKNKDKQTSLGNEGNDGNDLSTLSSNDIDRRETDLKMLPGLPWLPNQTINSEDWLKFPVIFLPCKNHETCLRTEDVRMTDSLEPICQDCWLKELKIGNNAI